MSKIYRSPASDFRAQVVMEVWDLSQIQTFLNTTESSAKRTVLEEGFPRPIVNKERNRRWLASAVKDYFFKRSSGEIQDKGAKSISSSKPNINNRKPRLVK